MALLLSQSATMRAWRSSMPGMRRCSASTKRGLSGSASPHHRRHIVFGANTDVGKTVVAAGLVRSSRFDRTADSAMINYVKPMQCGGSDERFVHHVLHLDDNDNGTAAHPYQVATLFDWETPASPHTSSRLEGLPISDDQVLQAFQAHVHGASKLCPNTITWCETAGGVLSPGASSPDNDRPWHARQAGASTSSPQAWGWQPQADLYRPLAWSYTAVLVGDATLGGISATLSSLESLIWRGYHVPAIVLINPVVGQEIVHANAVALQEYTLGRYPGHDKLRVVDLPAIPPDPAVPLDEWYRSEQVSETFQQLNQHLAEDWAEQCVEDEEKPVTSATTAPPGDASFALHLAQRYSQQGIQALQTPSAQESLTEQVLDQSSNESWASHGGPWVTQTDVTVADLKTEARRYALATYQRRMRVTPEQRESMEWAICHQSIPEIQEESGHDADSENHEDEEEDLSWVSAENLALDAPTLAFSNGTLRIRFPEGLEASDDTVTEFDSVEKALDVVARRIAPKLYSQYKELIEMQWLVYEHSGINRKIGAIEIEPVLSRDHVWVDPLWQRALIEIGEARNIPIIFDETGLDVAMRKGSEILHVEPDVAIVGNAPSASGAPIMTILYTDEVSDALAEDDSEEEETNLDEQSDGIDCLAAEHKLHLQNMNHGSQLLFPEEQVRHLSKLDQVQECFALGNVLSVTVANAKEIDSEAMAERIRAKLTHVDASVVVQGNRLVTVMDTFVGREDKRNVVDFYREELQ